MRSRASIFVFAAMLPLLGILNACGGIHNGNTDPDPSSTPIITSQPANEAVIAGQTATFTVVAAGVAPLSYQWYQNGAEVGSNSGTYTTAPTTAANNQAQIQVKVSNTAGTMTSNAVTLTVSATAVAPTITTQPTNETVTAGQTATFTVVAASLAPLSYQWYQNGVQVGSNSSTYTTAPATTAINQAQVLVKISNTAGTVTSNTVTLTVSATAVAPTITTQPMNETVTAGQTATFTVVAAGVAPLSYQWYQNGAEVGSNSGTYTTAPTTAANNQAQIQVKVSNTAGTMTSNAVTLTVSATAVAPTITTQPTNETVTAGQTATFTVVAASLAPLSYQWYQNGVQVGSNSSTYTTAPATTAINQAQVLVKISNTAGTVTSNAVTLTVITASGVNASCGTIQNLVNANPAGTTFVLPAGICRMQSIVPKDGDIFMGQSGAILNGSMLVSTFSQQTIGGVSYWVAAGPSQPGEVNGICDTAHPMCMYPEDFFINDQPLLRVASLSAVIAGTCYFDYSAASVYFVDDPTGKTVEIGVTTHAFSGSATNVTIRGLTIEKYAVPASDGAISAGASWTIENNVVLLNHGGGIRMNTGQVTQSNYVHHNGQEGVAGSGSNILIQDNEIAHNNTLGFDFGWEAGGLWFSNSTNQVVQGNYVHDNQGLGIHLDYQSYNWLVQGNRTSNNLVSGFDIEIGYDGTARYNIIENEGSNPGYPNPSMWRGCGMNIYASQNVQVYGNTVINNSNGICALSISRGSGNRGEFVVQNVSVHDNVIVQNVGSATGAVAASGEYMDVYSSSWNNHWASNTYQLAPSVQLAYVWEGGSSYVSMDASQWQSFGQDTDGIWISPTDSTFPSAKFTPNQAVSAVASTPVWSLPTTTSTLVTTEVSGAQGTTTQAAGPILSGGVWWWNVNYDDGNAGWSEETDLQIF